MKSSPDKWMMGIVCAFGVYAVYRLIKAPKDQASTETESQGKFEVPSGVATLDNPLKLSQGRWYRARIENGDPASLQNAFALFGLNGNVLTSVDQARAAGFPDWALAGATPQTSWFYGSATMTTGMPRPAGVLAMWIASPPR